MNRTVIVSLIQKNIDELILLTQGFMEMSEYPRSILNLAQLKTDDIRTYIEMLRDLQPDAVVEKTGVPAVENLEKEVSEVCEVSVIAEIAEDKVSESEVTVIPDTAEVIVVLEEEEEEEDVDEEEDIEVEDIEDDFDDEHQHYQMVEEKVNHVEEVEEVDEVHQVEEEVEPNPSQAPKVTTLSEKMASGNISRNDSLARENNGIHSSIANKRVDDIRQAISLGDRFRFQRELFRNNGEEMNKILSYINLLATYDEVVLFLQSKYSWPDESSAAKDFYQIVRRKF